MIPLISLNYDITTGIAKFAATTIVKQAGDCPVQLNFSAAPGEVSDIALSLGSDSSAPQILAYTEAWSQVNSTTWTALLDMTDTRLAAYMTGKGATAVNLELVVTVDGETQYAPNISLTVQPPIKTGPDTSEGGPTYYTQAQVDSAIAAALAGVAPAPVQTDLTPAAAGTAPLFAATLFGWLRRRILPGVGSGVYTADYTLPDAAQANNAIVKLNIEFPASANPNVTIHDTGGALLSTFTNPEPAAAYYTYAEYYFDGTAWHELFRESRPA
jgi:hypothetical protein